MSKKEKPDWNLIDKVVEGTATEEELQLWGKLVRQQKEYSTLIPWLRKVRTEQQNANSPFYAADAWEHIRTTLPVAEKKSIEAPLIQNAFSVWKKAGMMSAAVIIMGLFLWIYPVFRHPASEKAGLTGYFVANGQKQLLTLPDGSKIWINSGSSVKIAKHASRDTLREVWLDGEGFFDVQKNPLRPFLVHTGSTTIRVLGTSFNIDAYQDSTVAVTVNTGKVLFTSDSGREIMLKANQRSVWSSVNGQFQTSSTDAPFYSAWRDGILQFRDEPLLSVIEKLERRFEVPINVVGDIGNHEYCTARFAANESLDNILESLRHIYGLNITHTGGIITIKSKQKGK